MKKDRPMFFENVIVSSKEGELLREGVMVCGNQEWFTIITAKNERFSFEKRAVNVRKIHPIAA